MLSPQWSELGKIIRKILVKNLIPNSTSHICPFF
jgi:hypothetical protein